jgi:hypothetical protein
MFTPHRAEHSQFYGLRFATEEVHDLGVLGVTQRNFTPWMLTTGQATAPWMQMWIQLDAGRKGGWWTVD